MCSVLACLAEVGRMADVTTREVMDGVPDSTLWETLASRISLYAKDPGGLTFSVDPVG